MSLWPEVIPKIRWDGWHCTRCKQYHGYGSVFTHTPHMLCAMCHYSVENGEPLDLPVKG